MVRNVNNVMPGSKERLHMVIGQIQNNEIENVYFGVSYKFTDEQFFLLMESFKNNYSVQSLSFKGVNLSSKSMIRLLYMIYKNDHINNLTLSGKCFNSDFYVKLCVVLKNKQNVSSLDFAMNNLNSDAVDCLTYLIECNKNIIDVKANVGRENLEEISALLERNEDYQNWNVIDAIVQSFSWFKSICHYYFSMLSHCSFIESPNVESLDISLSDQNDLQTSTPYRNISRRLWAEKEKGHNMGNGF